MKKIAAVSLLLFFAYSLLIAEEGKKYGKDLSINETTKVSEILSTPENFEGKKVLIEGTIVDVCEKAGCWIDISSDKEQEKIRVKVEDGQIVFPMEAKGKTAKVEGEVFSVMVTPESCEGEGGSAPCTGAESDGCAAKKKQGTKKYLLKGIGAVIN